MSKRLKETSENKSKVIYYEDGKKGEYKAGIRENYINKLTRNQVNIIISARGRMLDVKSNYRNKHTDLLCRMCEKMEETQTHILEECDELKETQKVTKEMIFQKDITDLRKTAKNISKKLEILGNK